MKTITKVLSMLLVIVMCASIFGVSAYADEEPTVAKIAGSDVGYETLPAAVLAAGSGSTINLLANVTLTDNLDLNKDLSLNLNGFTLTLGGFRILASGNVSIKNGTIWGQGNDIASAGSSLKLYDVTFDKVPADRFVPAGYHVTGPEGGWYTVEPGSDPAPYEPYYYINTNKYEKGSNEPVYIRVPAEDAENPTNYYIYGSKLIELKVGQNCTWTSDSSYNYCWLFCSFLDTLTAGETYYFRYCDASDNNVYYMCDELNNMIYLNVRKGDLLPNELDLQDRYGNEWYQGDNPLQFVVDPYPGSNNTQISVDGKRLGNLDWYDYHSGYFYLGTGFLQSLDSGWHTLTIKAVDSGASGECNFYVGATLVAKDTDKHVTGSSRTLKFVCSEPINRIWVGDKELDGYDDYYTLSKDRKTITLTAKFLNNRTAGNTYTLTVKTNSGESLSTTFQILTTAQGSASPRTGDEANFALWAALLVMSGAAAVVVLPRLRKNED